MSALRTRARHVLTLLILVVELMLHKRPPGGSSDAPSSSPGGADGTGGAPSRRRGNIDAGQGIASAQDATGAEAAAGEPMGGDGQSVPIQTENRPDSTRPDATAPDRPAIASAQSPAASPQAAPAPDGQRLSREQAEALQAELPPPVVHNTGVKTHGRWVNEHGDAQAIVSGRDADSARAWAILQERGIPVRAETTRVTDVEQKLAARMVAEGRRHLDVVLNNRPCKGPYGCDTVVPVILPEGYSMTVHAPRYRKTFTGGARPW